MIVHFEDHSLYAEYRRPLGNHPTLILLNGLGQSAAHWSPFIEHLSNSSLGYLRLDFRGQGKSLEWELRTRGSFTVEPTVEEQCEDLERLIAHFEIPERFIIVGFSYGGGVAMHFAAKWASAMDKLILFVPYVMRLDMAFPLQRAWVRQMEAFQRFGLLPPAATSSLERWYNRFLANYMDHRYQTHVPDAEIRNACIRMTFGIMKYNAFPILSQLPKRSLHLISVGRDVLEPKGLYAEVWAKTPPEVRESWLYLEDGGHFIIDQAPGFCARWVERIVDGDPRLSGGRQFRGYSYSQEAETPASPREPELRIKLDEPYRSPESSL